jgi:hypothetical protein
VWHGSPVDLNSTTNHLHSQTHPQLHTKSPFRSAELKSEMGPIEERAIGERPSSRSSSWSVNLEDFDDLV